jgi:hypothetical protein
VRHQKASLWLILCLLMISHPASAETLAARQFAIATWRLLKTDHIETKKAYWERECSEQTSDAKKEFCVNKLVDMVLYHEMVCLMDLGIATMSWTNELKSQFDNCLEVKVENYNIFTAMVKQYAVSYQEQLYSCMVKSESYRDLIDFPVHETLKTDNPFPRLNHENAIACLTAIK